VNIYGNNYNVNINQIQNVQSSSDGCDNGGNSYHVTNLRCLLICATVKCLLVD
jgi:hypothetical protein